MNKNLQIFITGIIAMSFFLFSCDQTSEKKEDQEITVQEEVTNNEILIEAENFTDKSDDLKGMEKSEKSNEVLTSGGEGWLAYEVKVPAAGRYSVEIKMNSEDEKPSIFWIEDYYDNKDGRAYNITGNLRSSLEKTDPIEVLKKDGSPLNIGTHKMKLHYKDGKAAIDWIKFRLIRPHKLTPNSQVQNTSGKSWTVVWSDEFEEPGLPDSTKWTYDIGDWGWGNNELQYYTENRLENARVEDGNLIIEAIKGDFGHDWTSARLTTRGKVNFLYGRIEFRAKVPRQRGNWAAGWTLGDEYVDEISWPYCGEIDILESVGYEMNDETGDGTAHASVHCGAYYFKLGNQPTAIVDVKNMHETFHTYAVDWTPEGIKGYVDGQEYFSYSDTSTDLAWPFNKPQNIILNLAMGGGWGGAQGMDESIISQKFVVDYVRVYELQ